MSLFYELPFTRRINSQLISSLLKNSHLWLVYSQIFTGNAYYNCLQLALLSHKNFAGFYDFERLFEHVDLELFTNMQRQKHCLHHFFTTRVDNYNLRTALVSCMYDTICFCHTNKQFTYLLTSCSAYQQTTTILCNSRTIHGLNCVSVFSLLIRTGSMDCTKTEYKQSKYLVVVVELTQSLALASC